jgi:hypothetical protein
VCPFAAQAEHHDEMPSVGAIVAVQDAYIKTPVKGAKAAAGLMKIYNNAAEDNALVAVETDAAEVVELHVMEMDGDIMKMKKVESFNIPAQSHLELSMETGNHLMFINPVSQWNVGDAVNVTMTFENGAFVSVEMPVKDADEDMKPHKEHDHHSHHGGDDAEKEAHEMHQEHSHEDVVHEKIKDGAEDESAVDIEKHHGHHDH